MGQAKNRGSYEQRVAEAKMKNDIAEKVRIEEEAKNPRSPSQKRAALSAMILAAVAGSVVK